MKNRLGPYVFPLGMLVLTPFGQYAKERIELNNIEKQFGKAAAIYHALVIEEGAKKSTALKISGYGYVKAGRDYRKNLKSLPRFL